MLVADIYVADFVDGEVAVMKFVIIAVLALLHYLVELGVASAWIIILLTIILL